MTEVTALSVEASPTVGSPRSTRVTLLAAGMLVLLASGLPQVVDRELLERPVTADRRALLALSVIGAEMLAPSM